MELQRWSTALDYGQLSTSGPHTQQILSQCLVESATGAMDSSNPYDIFSSDELTPLDYWNVPTPGGIYQPSPNSPFTQYGATLSTDHHETPNACTPCPQPCPQPEKLALLQLSEWDRNKTYDDAPPTCLCVTIGWKLSLNGKPFAQDTEQDVVLTLADYWDLFLHPKVEKFVAKRRTQKKNMALQRTKVTVSVTQRSERDLIKQYDGTSVDWAEIERQLMQWGEFFRSGKALRVDMLVYYDDRDGAGQQSTIGSRVVDKRSAQSATQRMRAELTDELEAEQAATGQAAIWPQVYNLFECPLLSCNSSKYCWVDPIGKIHRPLNTPQLRELVKYRQNGNVLETHSDVPDYLQEKIRSEDQQRRDRKRKARALSPQGFGPVHITNVIPGKDELPSLQQTRRGSVKTPNTVSALDIPGFRDDAVHDYVRFLQGKVRSKRHRDEFGKAGRIVLDNLLDLDQVFQEHKVEFFTAREVELAPAIQFIRDIPAFVQHRQTNGNQEL